MAEPLKFRAPPAEVDSAQAELQSLLNVLHESGTLRVLRGLFGGIPAVTDIALEHVHSEGGKRLSGNLAVLATGLTHMEPHAVQRLLRGLIKGSELVVKNAARTPPGFFSLLREMHSEEARRGLQALVIMLQSIGRALVAEADNDKQSDPAVLPEGRP